LQLLVLTNAAAVVIDNATQLGIDLFQLCNNIILLSVCLSACLVVWLLFHAVTFFALFRESFVRVKEVEATGQSLAM